MFNRLAVAALALLLACCAKPEPVTPALWEVTGPNGEQAWLFGTIHALPAPVDWRSDQVDGALSRADVLVLEVAQIDEPEAMAAQFARLARSPGLPPLLSRIADHRRADLAATLGAFKLNPTQFGDTETWAVALTLNQHMAARLNSDPANGIDLALRKEAGSMRIAELEGAAAQLGIFDSLPGQEQRDLLQLVAQTSGEGPQEYARLTTAWKRGDMEAIAALANRSLLSDPELREALLTARNRAWLVKLQAMLGRGARPFVAVGAAHLAGPDGLPEMLAARRFKVRRVQ